MSEEYAHEVHEEHELGLDHESEVVDEDPATDDYDHQLNDEDQHHSADELHHNYETHFDQSSIPVDYSRYNSGFGHNRTLDDSAFEYHNHSDVYPSLRKVNSPTNARQSMDDSYFLDSRMQKIAQNESLIRQEMFKECTFRPKIKSLPASYGPLKENGTSFEERVIKWENQRKIDAEHKAKLAEQASQVECTFRPQINRNSMVAAKDRQGDSPETAADRLFRHHEDSRRQRREFIEQEIMEERKIEEQECTFQPKLLSTRNPQYEHVQSKVRLFLTDPKSALKPKEPLVESPPPECSFQPQINKIKPHMTSAQVYVSSNVVDRLTRTVPKDLKDKDRHDKLFDESFEQSQVVDAATFIGSLQSQQNNTTMQTPHSSKSIRQPKTAEESNQATARKVTSQDVDRFIERQTIQQKKQEQRLQQTTKQLTPNFKPKISAKSKEIAGTNLENNNASFLLRVQRELEKRKENEQRKELHKDRAYTFTPQINRKAASKPSRTHTELSLGDKFKHDAKLKMLQLEVEQQQSGDLTFKPQLSEKAKRTPGKLRLSEDPSIYLEWIKQKNAEKEKDRELEQKRKEDEEAIECTFSPKTVQCPAYISRIAESIQRMKLARGPSQENLRPDWK